MSTVEAERPAPAVDPRIRARRIEVRRQRGRRRLRVVVGVAVAGVLAVLAAVAAASSAFDVDRIAVHGATRTDPSVVAAATGVALGDALVALDTGEVAAAVEQLPWVAEAEVRRSLRGTVTVTVTERQPVATVPVVGGGWVLVDGAGRQLEQVPEPAPDAVLVRGVEASGVPGEPVAANVQAVLRLLHALTPPVRAVVGGVGMEGPDLVLDLSIGGRVRLGDAADLDAKLVALETMLARVDLRCLHELDLGVPSAPALTRRAPAQGDPDAPLSDLSECP